MNPALTLPAQSRPAPVISNGRLGMMLLIGTETILFSSFIGAYLVLRMSAAAWPPPGIPVLHLGWASVNTGFLVLSSILLSLSLRFEMPPKRAGQGIFIVLLMGFIFLLLQVLEFHRLYARGLTLRTGTYGALFYSLISCHGLHVIGGLVILMAAFRKAGEWLGHAEIYWHFVTGVWLILFGILYLW